MTPLDHVIIQIIPPNRRPYVACSMGRDSLALLFACHRLAQMGQLLPPIALHVHHHMQAVADDWAKQFEQFCQKHAIEYQILHVYPNKSNEQSARQARFVAMAGVMTDDGLLLTAHHANDQAETVLMRLINGAGMTGLAGMAATASYDVGNKTITIVRPWLNISRQAISRYAHDYHLPYVDDPTNQHGSTRAKLRHIMPLLAQINPSVVDNINRTSDIAKDMKDIGVMVADNVLQQAIITTCTTCDYLTILNSKAIVCQPLPTQRLVMYHLLGNRSIYPPPYRLVVDVMALMANTTNDHHSEIFWVGANAMIFAYDNKLFVLAKVIFDYLKHQNHCHMPSWFMIKGAKVVCVVDRYTKISVGQKQLSGKKLYQSLKIPPIFRPCLLLCCYQGVQYLATLGISWRLSADSQQTALPAFEPIASFEF